jgi:hypothetical protein
MATATAPTFLDLWNSFPDDLKLEILKYTVPSRERYSDRSFDVLNFHLCHNAPNLALKYHVVLLLSCPEIKPLVTEAFYAQNLFALQQEEFDVRGFFYPRRSVNHHIRAISIWIRYTDPWPIEFLSRIAKGQLGFARPRSLKIMMDGGQYKVSADSFREFLEWFGTVTFPVRRLEVVYYHNKRAETEQEMLVLDKLIIDGEESKVKSEVTRYYERTYGTYGKEGSLVDVWPEREEHGRERMTKKVLLIAGR